MKDLGNNRTYEMKFVNGILILSQEKALKKVRLRRIIASFVPRWIFYMKGYELQI